MKLGDFLPDGLKNRSQSDKLLIGTVLRLKVKETKPPKVKRFIVVGFTDDHLSLASVYINSTINGNVNWSQDLRDLHISFEKNEERNYLDKDSFIDCSNLVVRDCSEIKAAIEKNPEAIIGEINNSDLKTIKNMLQTSPTIKGKYKKKFGLYD